MKNLFRQLAAVATLLLLISDVAHAARCDQLDKPTAAWMASTISLWNDVSAESLHLAERQLPLVIFFDEQCVWETRSSTVESPGSVLINANGQKLIMQSSAHTGMIPLPEGGEIPPQLILFASTFGEDRNPYHVMPLPSIWRKAPHHADEPENELNELIRSVFVHEMTHTQQSFALGARIDAIVAAQGLDDSLNDDIVQDRFSDNPGFVAAVERERDLLYDAAAAESDAVARQLAAQVLQSMQQRDARYFHGDLTWLGELEDVFLYMEGAANWAAYRALLAQGVAPEEALPRLRRGGRYWSQDIGLALFLVIDRLLPDWQTTAFGNDPGTVIELLSSAVENSP